MAERNNKQWRITRTKGWFVGWLVPTRVYVECILCTHRILCGSVIISINRDSSTEARVTTEIQRDVLIERVMRARRSFTGAWHAGWPARRTPLDVREGTGAAAVDDGDVNWPKHYLWDTVVRN